MKRIPMIAGNWKLHKTTQEALELVKKIHHGLPQPGEVDVVVAPPFTAIKTIADFLKKSYIAVAGQNLYWENTGAYTGEISAPILKEAGASYVIIGHSERRQYFGETNETVNKKIKAALDYVMPIVCVGETLAQREADQTQEVIQTQITESLANLSDANMRQIIIAYEPIWAIGTGKTATPAQAEEVHAFIRQTVADLYSPTIADQLRILYGGSVKPDNAHELLAKKNIDGALVGGASLQAELFIDIIKSI
ncbi:MAG: triose-phosphate isomerase [Gammaproteobacteria bacterium RIFCSPHIGHO2_02_FULL_42_13]|nr:MAG: triose-phosphate isomerase [Gammaproteobacteria bacterium RIFCSPHIGHO2_02_FULL_42_13]OGT70743.1 MAG: triose-phosphate isomerase [Gammaproteobacteria bacterium RIFCSPLOWO2_02_FULL_42_9]